MKELSTKKMQVETLHKRQKRYIFAASLRGVALFGFSALSEKQSHLEKFELYMIKNLLLLICPLSLLLFGSCNRYDPTIKESFAAKAEILDSLEADIDVTRLCIVNNGIVRYDVPDVGKYCNPYRFSFKMDSGTVVCRYDNALDSLYEFDFGSLVLHDTAYFENEVRHFFNKISALTSGTGFVFGGYVCIGKGVRKKQPKHKCLIILYKDNEEYHLCCHDSQDREKTINSYQKDHPHIQIYEITENWVLFKQTESLYDLHINKCG